MHQGKGRHSVQEFSNVTGRVIDILGAQLQTSSLQGGIAASLGLENSIYSAVCQAEACILTRRT